MELLLRIWRTVRHLRTRQVLNRLSRRAFLDTPNCGTPLTPRARHGSWVPPLDHAAEWVGGDRVEILARTGFVREPGDWRHAFGDALRLYHLHYLDQLSAAQQPEPSFPGLLLERWVTQNPPGSRPGWEPYPTSRRLVNAFKACLNGHRVAPAVLASLADQCRYLCPRLEFHLLANHLFANAKALAFAGLFFEGAEAQRWLDLAVQLLRQELPEQIGADGGHFERSPMYHAIVLADLLDLLNLSRCFGDGALAELVRPRCAPMLAWLAQLCHPDGDLAFFNDTALGVASSFDELAEYAARLEVHAPAADQRAVAVLAPSAFARMGMGEWHALLDVGGPAPAYQPGHAHAGTLSFELSYGAFRVIVNSGISTYEASAIRAQERGTRAHNAVTLDGRDSSEVWHSFRVGARARVIALSHGNDAQSAWVSATHDGYRRTSYRALHTRQWRISGDTLEITDTVAGEGMPSAEASLHLHPDCIARLESPGQASIVTPDKTRFNLQLDGQMEWRIEDYLFSEGFGCQRLAQVIRGATRRRLPLATCVRVKLQQ